MTESQVIDALGAMAQETRLRIVKHLVRCGPEGETAGAIGKKVKASSSRLSFHLAALEQAGLISSQRVSRNIVYRANFDKLGKLVGYLINDCCADHPAVRNCC